MNRKNLMSLLGFGLAFLLTGATVAAQYISVGGLDYQRVTFFTNVVEDDDTGVNSESPILWVKYVGSEESGTVDLNGNALEFFSGDIGSEAAPAANDSDDVNTGDDCGSARGALDVTNSSCDTPEELVAVINGNTSDWVAVLAGITQDESLATAAEYVDPADAQAKLPGGLALFIDSTDVDSLAMLMRPDSGTKKASEMNTNDAGHGDIEFFLNRPAAASYTQTIKDNPFEGQRALISQVVAVVDSTSAWTLNIWARRYNGGVVDERLVYSTDDTTDDTDKVLDFSRAPLVSNPGETFLVEVVDDAMVTARIAVSGMFIPAR